MPGSNAQRLQPDDLTDIQGNMVGFNKDHQRLVFVSFPDVASGKRFLAGLAGKIDNADEVKRFNDQYKARLEADQDPLSEPADWANVAISGHGLTTLQAAGATDFPAEFMDGLRGRAAANGDVDQSDPTQWQGAFAPGELAVDAVLIIAADRSDLLDDRTAELQAVIATAGVTVIGAPQDGNVLPAPLSGHEHFGFKDGISQPGIAGLVHSNRGGDEIAPGEFLIGYEDELGVISGSASGDPSRPLQPTEPGYPGNTPQPLPALPSWAKNGSFLVYRRLRQDVASFRAFVAGQPAGPSVTADQLAAKLIGRWPSGAPLEHVPGEPADADTVTADPGDGCPAALEPDHINNFGYQEHDQDGHLTPKAAHIRKVYPRDSEPPGEDGPTGTSHHRILRRGIPYGDPFVPTDPAYGSTVPPDQDRGLLFLCYQSSIANGFEFIQQNWVNNANFPEAGDGQDPIISQNVTAPPFQLTTSTQLTTQRWVITTGGEYFFAPAISALVALAQ